MGIWILIGGVVIIGGGLGTLAKLYCIGHDCGLDGLPITLDTHTPIDMAVTQTHFNDANMALKQDFGVSIPQKQRVIFPNWLSFAALTTKRKNRSTIALNPHLFSKTHYRPMKGRTSGTLYKEWVRTQSLSQQVSLILGTVNTLTPKFGEDLNALFGHLDPLGLHEFYDGAQKINANDQTSIAQNLAGLPNSPVYLAFEVGLRLHVLYEIEQKGLLPAYIKSMRYYQNHLMPSNLSDEVTQQFESFLNAYETDGVSGVIDYLNTDINSLETVMLYS